jgi:hypothetical protein
VGEQAMSGLGIFGGNKSASTQTVYSSLSVQSSALGVPIALVWGAKRLQPNLIWYNDFTATPEKHGKKGGGKGGDGKGAGGVYTYSTAVIFGLCEGPITGIGTVWADKTITNLGSLGLTLFAGTAGQAPWSYVVSAHPSQARSYAYTAYLANGSYALGRSPNLPNHNFEVQAYAAAPNQFGTGDCAMADIIPDLLTSPQYGIAIPSSTIDATSLAKYRTYCAAQSLFFSPDLTQQEQVSAVLDRWAKLTNSWIFWSGSALKFVPLGDTTITGNGTTYTPVIAAIYDLGYDDFIIDGQGLPVNVSRTDPADAPNHVRLEIKDRNNAYNSAVAEWKDQGLVDAFGMIDSPNTQAHEICNTFIGQVVAQLIGQRGAYIRNTYEFKLGWEFCLLEPGDIVTLTDPHLGISLFPVRIRTLDEDEHGNWAVVAEEFPIGVAASNGTQPAMPTSNTPVNFDAAPGHVNPPAVFEPNSKLTGGVPQLWIAASGGANWGGAVVYASFDGTNYYSLGTITNASAQGTLTATLASHADPDGTNTLSIDTTSSQVVLPTDATHADADAFRTLSILTPTYATAIPNNSEVIAYGTAVSTGTFTNNLTYLRRGLYGSTIASRASGDNFTRLNLNQTAGPVNSMLVYNLPAQYVGVTVHLKFCSFNRFGNAIEDISTVTDYTYTPAGTGYGGGAGGVPTTPTGLASTASVNANILSWNANPTTDSVSSYTLYAGHGTSLAFGSCSPIATITGLTYTHSGLGVSDTWTYYLVASNAVGGSAAEGPVNGTTLSTTGQIYLPSAFFPSTPTASAILLLHPVAEAITFAANFAGSTFTATANATGATVFTINKALAASPNTFSAIGTATIGAGGITCTFASTGGTSKTFAAGDVLQIVAPASPDATLANPAFALLATR